MTNFPGYNRESRERAKRIRRGVNAMAAFVLVVACILAVFFTVTILRGG